jgi:hypothetical protein
MRAAAADWLETWFGAHIGSADAPQVHREGTPARRFEDDPACVGTPEGTPGDLKKRSDRVYYEQLFGF